MVTGFKGFFINAGNAVVNYKQTLKSMSAPENLLKSSFNGATLGLVGTVSNTVDNVRTAASGGAYGAGKIVGQVVAEATAMLTKERGG